MKFKLLALALVAVLTQALAAQQATPPAPPGMKSQSEKVEAEILKVYALDDQGARFRAYVVKYKGTEVIVSDDLGTTQNKIGDKITFLAFRAQAPLGAEKVNLLQFKIMALPSFKKP